MRNNLRYITRKRQTARLPELAGFSKMFAKVQFSQSLLNVTEDVLLADLVGFLKMVFFSNKAISLVCRISEDILHMLRQSSDRRLTQIVDFQRCSTLRFSLRLPKMFHLRISRISEDYKVQSTFPNHSIFRGGYPMLPKMSFLSNQTDFLMLTSSVMFDLLYKSYFRSYSAHDLTVLDLPNESDFRRCLTKITEDRCSLRRTRRTSSTVLDLPNQSDDHVR